MSSDPLRKLFELIARLRGPNGCPWDQEQTVDNILSDLIEETYELQWANAQGRADEMLDELGDVVFVLTFAVSLLQDKHPSISIETATQHAYDKIYRRHPHVFGDATADTKEEGLAHWERMKAEERATTERDGLFADIPGNLPPLRRAEKIQRRAAGEGFDWDNVGDIIEKIREELGEVERAISTERSERVEEEVGDLLFSLVNLARFLNIDSDKSLAATNVKFALRYDAMRRLVFADGKDFTSMTLEQMDEYWEKAKSL